MIIVLSGADFSESNIGQVTIPHELSEFTKEFLTHYTKSLTDSQKVSVDNFISGLRAAGIWDKMHYLFFPILSQTMDESYYNPMDKTDLPTSYYLYKLANDGLMIDTSQYVEGHSCNGGIPRAKTTINLNGYHLAALTTAVTGSGNVLGSFKSSLYPSVSNRQSIICYSKCAPNFGDVQLTKAALKLANHAPYQQGAAFSSETSFMLRGDDFAPNDGITDGAVMTDAPDISTFANLQPLSNGNASSTTMEYLNTNDICYLWSFGDSLTKTEAMQYSQLASAFLRGMGINA